MGYPLPLPGTDPAPSALSPQTYFGMDVSAVEDPVQRRALETMIKTYGQTPRQLFQAAHVGRAGARLGMEGELPAAVGLLVQLAFRESREQTKEAASPVRAPGFSGVQQHQPAPQGVGPPGRLGASVSGTVAAVGMRQLVDTAWREQRGPCAVGAGSGSGRGCSRELSSGCDLGG